MSNDKVFCGSGKEWEFGVNVNLCLSDVPEEYISEYEGKKWLKLNVTKRKAVSDKGTTHYVEVDTYQPKEERQQEPPQQPAPPTEEDFNQATADDTDIPF